MVRQFTLLDNTYCSGILSADGHQWSDTAFATDYMEKSFAGFPRSYPDGMDDDDIDAIAYAPSGFIWDNAIAHGQSLRVYGEFAITETAWNDPGKKDPRRSWTTTNDFINQTNLIAFGVGPLLNRLRPYLNAQTVGWDMAIPDVFRPHSFIKNCANTNARASCPT